MSAQYATDNAFYREGLDRVPVVAEKFCPKVLRNSYESVYLELFHDGIESQRIVESEEGSSAGE